MTTIDCIDTKGNIREHDVSRVAGCTDFTRCGMRIRASQKPSGNARCGRCDLLRRSDAIRDARSGSAP